MSACRKCGSTKPPEHTCSRCGGRGLVTGYMGEPTDCPHCGGSGTVYPPYCPDCSAFRSTKDAA